MSIYTIYEENIYHYFDKIIELSLDERATKKNKDSIIALNINIILCSACLLEGVFEDRGKIILRYYIQIYNSYNQELLEIRKTMNTFYNNIEKYLSATISQTTGFEKYNSLYELLLNQSIKKDPQLAPLIEGINTLFHLRNVIAHGRLIHAEHLGFYYTKGTEENFIGGYKKTEDYLKKQKLIDKGFIKAHKRGVYFSNEIADHFYSLTQKFIEGMDNFICSNLFISDNTIAKLKEYNESHKTNYDILTYIRRCGELI